ncbi:agamous-like MADS-box protein AGL61 [Impatiens glandulifera]|uniref:agamous-like MADS-box protein AGL61 n=1 Tax=Impatiens glandulifera TaxID=253017 RepID=UPI001FB09F55|nr:agamous-like MADS-box protein AGL61 [Impatiens glandulifera]
MQNNMEIDMTNKKKKTMGKQKIEMKKIEKLNYRQVTFSKRRAGLFKKATELCVLTGANVLALVTSPGNRTFTFSSQPNPEDLLRPENRTDGLIQRNQVLQKREYLNDRYEKLVAALEEEKKIGERLRTEEGSRRTLWWEEKVDLEKMGGEELEYYMMALERMKNNVENILMEKEKKGVFCVPDSSMMNIPDVTHYNNI